jgi:uncharacterized membrane protein YdfJ with MMPL/SSD domain
VVDLQETPYGGPTDGVGVIAAAIILLIALGSLLAMGLPIATALLGIGAGLSLIGLLGHLFPAPSFSPIVAGLIGLGSALTTSCSSSPGSGKGCGQVTLPRPPP